MPLVMRFLLQGEGPTNPHQHNAGLRAMVLGWIAAVQPGLAETFHEAGKPKPYTIGPLAQANRDSSCFDLSILTDWLAPIVLDGAARCNPAVRLGPQRFELSTEPAIVSRCEWSELMEHPAARPWAIELVTPTAHHATGKPRRAIVAPDPTLYFGSWLGRWKSCSTLPMPEPVDLSIRDALVLSAFRGGTGAVRLDGVRTFIGFVGEATFDMAPGLEADPETEACLGALASLANFSGTGVETMRGMGQTRLQPPRGRGR